MLPMKVSVSGRLSDSAFLAAPHMLCYNCAGDPIDNVQDKIDRTTTTEGL
jgi:hypothetical protein